MGFQMTDASHAWKDTLNYGGGLKLNLVMWQRSSSLPASAQIRRGDHKGDRYVGH